MKRKVDPLVEQGHKVFVPYSNERAFGTERKSRHSDRTYFHSRSPTPEFLEWMANIAGPVGVLWISQKAQGEGLNIYFHQAKHAMLAKLTWGGL